MLIILFALTIILTVCKSVCVNIQKIDKKFLLKKCNKLKEKINKNKRIFRYINFSFKIF
jgi:uncharacterized membrane protein